MVVALVLLAVALAVALGTIAWLLAQRSAERAATRSITTGLERRVELNDAKASGFDALRVQLDEAIAAKDRYFAHIHQATQERDRWALLYGDAHRMFGPAQEQMLAEIERLSHAAKAEPRGVFLTLVRGFRDMHPPPQDRPRDESGLPLTPQQMTTRLDPGVDSSVVPRVA